MKKDRTIVILSYLFFLFLLPGCQEKEWGNTSNSLGGTSWIEYYTDQGIACSQQLNFYNNGAGSEIITRGSNMESYSFYWSWDYDEPSVVWIEYGDNDYVRFEITLLGNDILTGYFDGVYVSFVSY